MKFLLMMEAYLMFQITTVTAWYLYVKLAFASFCILLWKEVCNVQI